MAGIIFPNVMGTLAPLIQMDQVEKRNALEMDRIRRQDALDAEDREAGSQFGAAMQGDPAAIAKVSANPKFAIPLAQHLQRMDANQRAKLKEQFEVTGKTAAGILALPDAEQPAAYEAAYQNLTQQGYKINLPPKWSPALKNQLQGYAIQVPEYLKVLSDRPTPMGGAPGAPAAAPPNRDAFVQTMMPHALEVSKATGLDPRLVIAQAALETGYGQSAPGNNYFGIKSHGRAGGQTLPTMEAGPNGMYGARESFRTYGSPSESARDYAEFLKTNGRYAPVLQAQGLDAQIEAMGRSGYATDPNYGAKLRQIAQGLPEPPQVAQGDTQPRADASGNPLQPASGDPEVFGIKAWLAKAMPGATPMGVRGKPVYDSQGKLMITKPDGSVDFVDVPKPQQPPAGYRPAGGGLEPIPGGPADPQRQRAEKVPPGYRLAADGQSLEFIPGGPADPAIAKKAQPMTEGQANAALYADRMRAAEKVILANESAGQSAVGKALEVVPGGNYLQGEGYQLYEQARRDFINAVLRRESGAVISDAEFANAEKQYFPRPGDKPDVLKQKAENRRIAIEGISRAAGSTYKPEGGQSAQPQGTPAPQSGDKARMLGDARAAIQQGAPRDKVIERLKAAGITEEP